MQRQLRRNVLAADEFGEPHQDPPEVDAQRRAEPPLDHTERQEDKPHKKPCRANPDEERANALRRRGAVDKQSCNDERRRAVDGPKRHTTDEVQGGDGPLFPTYLAAVVLLPHELPSAEGGIDNLGYPTKSQARGGQAEDAALGGSGEGVREEARQGDNDERQGAQEGAPCSKHQQQTGDRSCGDDHFPRLSKQEPLRLLRRDPFAVKPDLEHGPLRIVGLGLQFVELGQHVVHQEGHPLLSGRLHGAPLRCF
mmetsp:Transcript_61600/g.177315  ORF Transcript_61600/g.177315 Transcript_61600/m.177315 type:complete len:253 (-) Transcript_61600:953-1711(-)